MEGDVISQSRHLRKTPWCGVKEDVKYIAEANCVSAYTGYTAVDQRYLGNYN